MCTYVCTCVWMLEEDVGYLLPLISILPFFVCVPLCSPGGPGTCYVDYVDKVRDPTVSAS